jgi:hypothetical protein
MSQTQIAPTGTATTGDTSQNPEKETKDSSRDYVILEQGGQTMWKELKVVHATSVESAIRSLATELKSGSRYVAVPKRNWNPVSPKVETKTTIALTFD